MTYPAERPGVLLNDGFLAKPRCRCGEPATNQLLISGVSVGDSLCAGCAEAYWQVSAIVECASVMAS